MVRRRINPRLEYKLFKIIFFFFLCSKSIVTTCIYNERAAENFVKQKYEELDLLVKGTLPLLIESLNNEEIELVKQKSLLDFKRHDKVTKYCGNLFDSRITKNSFFVSKSNSA
ncbi:hypothetical protein MXB_2647 [Myxobolus squamalis]|nr:hypothetical protein MXB_2647 [Myxobolus squamalis]